MISCIITAFKEPTTIKRAIDKMEVACIKAKVDYEILVITPDAETLTAAETYSGKNLRIIKDPGKGKPTALNIAFK